MLLKGIAIPTAALLLLGACTQEEVDPETERPLDIVVPGEDGFDFDHVLANGVEVTTSYSTDYKPSEWKITEPKIMRFELSVDDESVIPDGKTLYVENVHAEVALESDREMIDGLPQDTMDDRIHGAPTQPGFVVSDRYDYMEEFAIQGFSDTLMDGWGYVSGGSGYSEFSEKRLTEKFLVEEAGVWGNEFSFTWDVVECNEGGENCGKVAVFTDQFVVPTAQFLREQAEAERSRATTE